MTTSSKALVEFRLAGRWLAQKQKQK